jgi:hypothetical protein
VSIAKKPISACPSVSIDRNGVCWRESKRLVTTNQISPKGVKELAVVLNDRLFVVWRLLSNEWYDNAMLLPRDGNTMNYAADNTIALKSVSQCQGRTISDPDEIMKIWVTYERDRVPCWNLSEKTDLHFYTPDEFRSIIGDILSAGIR